MATPSASPRLPRPNGGHGRPARRDLAVLALAVMCCSPSVGARPEMADAEIRHLLDFVSFSQCVFIRSGVEYPSSEARTHLQRKLDYAGQRIRTADEFVAELASRSSTTGAAYRVRCGAEEMPSQAWLNTELDRFRKDGAAGRQ